MLRSYRESGRQFLKINSTSIFDGFSYFCLQGFAVTFATSYDGFGLAVMGMPVAIIAAITLFVLLMQTLITMKKRTSRQNCKIGIGVLLFTYFVFCPALSGSGWFAISSQNTTTAEYSWLLLICFVACCLLVVALASVTLFFKEHESCSDTAESRSVKDGHHIAASQDLTHPE